MLYVQALIDTINDIEVIVDTEVLNKSDNLLVKTKKTYFLRNFTPIFL